jgi:hypothetical protein
MAETYTVYRVLAKPGVGWGRAYVGAEILVLGASLLAHGATYALCSAWVSLVGFALLFRREGFCILDQLYHLVHRLTRRMGNPQRVRLSNSERDETSLRNPAKTDRSFRCYHK